MNVSFSIMFSFQILNIKYKFQLQISIISNKINLFINQDKTLIRSFNKDKTMIVSHSSVNLSRKPTKQIANSFGFPRGHSQQVLKKYQQPTLHSRRDHIKELLYQDYQQLKNKEIKKDQKSYLDTLRAKQLQPQFYGLKNNSQVYKSYQQSAHDDLKIKQTKSNLLKEQKASQDKQYKKKIQNSAIKSMQKGKFFKQYYSNVNQYHTQNLSNFNQLTNQMHIKREFQLQNFINTGIQTRQALDLKSNLERSQRKTYQKKLLLQDLQKQINHKQQLKSIQKVVRVDYNNSLYLKDIQSMKNSQIQVNNPQLTNIFQRRYRKNNTE